MASNKSRLVPFPGLSQTSTFDRNIVDLAYDMWLARGFRGSSPEEAFFVATLQVHGCLPRMLFLVKKPVLPVLRMVRK
jgi:hypothetical protein